MTALSILLQHSPFGYFYYDPAGLDKERREIQGITEACLQAEYPPKGWRVGCGVQDSISEILVDFEGRTDGPFLDRVKVV